jgi:hypothetical protein
MSILREILTAPGTELLYLVAAWLVLDAWASHFKKRRRLARRR